MRFQDWINQEVAKAKYNSLIARQIAAYLNAPTVTETPGEGTVMITLGIEELVGLVTPEEWAAITAPDAMWKEAAAADPASARAVDILLMQTFKTSNVPLESAAMAIIESEDVGLGTALITVLARAALLSPESVAALQSAMEQPAPSTWEVGPSIAQQAGGPLAWVDENQIQRGEI